MKKLLHRINTYVNKTVHQLRAYIKRLLFPLYLFPIKLITYSLYYLTLFLIHLAIGLIKIIINIIRWPFRSWLNFGKTILWTGIFLYFVFTEIRFLYLVERYGGYSKFFCSEWITSRNLKENVVRIVGGYSEGSGFFVSKNQVLTNFHVIADEPSPKVIFPDRSFVTPVKITANKNADLAILYLEKDYGSKILHFFSPQLLTQNEPLLAAGYPLGTELLGEVTVTKGFYTSLRVSRKNPVDYIQTSIGLVGGMSGGPLVDQCGEVVGVNTMSLSGLSFFISIDSIKRLWPEFSEQDIKKITVDPSKSPQDSVSAYYTYLKARRMKEGFDLLSREYLKKTNFQEWTSRFTDILDVQIFATKPVAGSGDTVFIKFATKNWIDGEVEYHYYQGSWQTVKEDNVFKMLKSKIEEIADPPYEWFYD